MDPISIGQKIKQAYPNSRYASMPDDLLGTMFLTKYKDGISSNTSAFNYLGGSSSGGMAGGDPFVDTFDPVAEFEKNVEKGSKPKQQNVIPLQGGVTSNSMTPSATLAPAKPKPSTTPLPTTLPNIQPGMMQDVLKKKGMFTL